MSSKNSNNRIFGRKLIDFDELKKNEVYILARLHNNMDFLADYAMIPIPLEEYIAHPVIFDDYYPRIGKYRFLNFQDNEETYYNYELIDDDNILQIYLPILPAETYDKISTFVQRGGKYKKSIKQGKQKYTNSRKKISKKLKQKI